MESSWYSLMPRGDFVTRGAIYDALVADSLPVVFDPEYFRHCAFHDVIDYDDFVTNIPEEDVVGPGHNVVQRLMDGFNKTDALQRIRRLHAVRHVFQYSLNPAHELIRFDRASNMSHHDDAFTFTWKAILRNVCQRRLVPLDRCLGAGLHSRDRARRTLQ